MSQFGKAKMLADGIVPDIIDEAPSAKITITYPGGQHVEFGKELTPTQVKDQPEVTWDADPSKYYLLSMVDPDAPSRKDPKFREVSHWMVANIRGNDLSKGDLIFEYAGSGAPKGSGLHRYTFFVFEQNGKISIELPEDVHTFRRNFSTRHFADKYKLGRPIAANYFNAQWDEYVDERRRQREGK